MTERDPRLDAAYREGATDGPPPEMDERIRAAARRAVAARPQSLEAQARADARRSWAARWRVPMSVAATVLVAVTLSYMVHEEETRKASVDGVPASAPPTPAPAAPAEKAQEAPASPPAPPQPQAPAQRPAPAADAANTAARPEPVPSPHRRRPPVAHSELAPAASRADEYACGGRAFAGRRARQAAPAEAAAARIQPRRRRRGLRRPPRRHRPPAPAAQPAPLRASVHSPIAPPVG
ncbi:MAG: hypothetical protein U1F45_05985 [Burkholderiales bacterium]